jgi:hypothetical protein
MWSNEIFASRECESKLQLRTSVWDSLRGKPERRLVVAWHTSSRSRCTVRMEVEHPALAGWEQSRERIVENFE